MLNIKKMKRRLLLFILLTILIPLFVSLLLTYRMTKHHLQQQTVSSNIRLIHQGKNNLSHYMDQLLLVSHSIYKDEKTYAYLQSSSIDYLADKEVYRTLQAISNSISEIFQIHLSSSASKRSFLVTKNIFRVGTIKNTAVRHNFDSLYEIYMEPPHLNSDYQMSRLSYIKPRVVVTLHRPIINALQQSSIGLLSIDFTLDKIQSIAADLYTQDDEYFYILDDNKQIIYSSQNHKLGEKLDEPWVNDILLSNSLQAANDRSDAHFQGIEIYEKLTIENTQWLMIKRIPYPFLYKNVQHFMFILFIVFFVLLTSSFLIILKVSDRITSPIQQSISQMIRFINQLIVREYRLKRDVKANKLRALQAQINPHFINNTLQSIGTLALQNGVPKIYSLIQSLASMMRYIMNTDENLVFFAKEIDHSKAYIALQAQRFENQFEMVWQIEENTLKILVPKMILQPLIENYFTHGVDLTNKKGWLCIKASLLQMKEGVVFRISVQDNGKGIAEDQLNRINKSIQTKKSLNSIGLQNVLTRIQFYFGVNAKLHLENRLPDGVQVLISIPLKRNI
jgi:two-component system sensor histidine kinase YesM